MIAHRLQTVLKTDRIIVMDKGRIIGQGKSSEMWQHQSGGFLPQE